MFKFKQMSFVMRERADYLTHKAPPIICSRRPFQILLLFQKQQKRHDISRESSAGRRFSCNIIPYFCRKLGKMSQVLIGALRVKAFKLNFNQLAISAIH